jgi:cytochrome c oxidase cbb3-type subunit 3
LTIELQLRAELGRRVNPGFLMLGCVVAALATACGGGGAGSAEGSVSADVSAQLRSLSEPYSGVSLAAIQDDERALDVGSRLFGAYCAGCHGADGTGERGVTNLTRGRYDFGTTAQAVRQTIVDGRHSEMPNFGREYGEVELGQLVAYLGTLSTGLPLSDYEERGRALYAERCVVCHSPDGTGDAELGTPDLTDDYWRHGDSMMNKRMVITRGAESQCPAHGAELSPAEVELLTAHVLRLKST